MLTFRTGVLQSGYRRVCGPYGLLYWDGLKSPLRPVVKDPSYLLRSEHLLPFQMGLPNCQHVKKKWLRYSRERALQNTNILKNDYSLLTAQWTPRGGSPGRRPGASLASESRRAALEAAEDLLSGKDRCAEKGLWRRMKQKEGVEARSELLESATEGIDQDTVQIQHVRFKAKSSWARKKDSGRSKSRKEISEKSLKYK